MFEPPPLMDFLGQPPFFVFFVIVVLIRARRVTSDRARVRTRRSVAV